MRSVEVTAKSREDAIEQALRKLGVERDEIETEILQHGSKGFLGIGARDWQLKVSTEVAAPASERPKRESGRDTGRSEGGRGEGGRSEGGRGGRGRGRRGGAGEGQREGQREATDAKPREPKRDDSRPAKRESKPRSGGRRVDGENKRSERPERKPRPERAERKPRPERKPREERQSETPGSAEVAVAAAAGPRRSTEASDTEAAALLQEMIQLMGIQCEVTHSEDEDKNLRLSVSSEDSALLIGRKGRGLASLQYVINRVARGIDGRDETERIIVDVEGYLDRRKQSLEEMALRMAERVKETGRRFSMRPMNPQERRVVHVALQDDEELRTFSVGDSAIRRVVIAPKDEEREERPRRRPQRDRNDRDERPERPERSDRPERHRERSHALNEHDNGNGNFGTSDDAVTDDIEDFDTYEFESDDAELDNVQPENVEQDDAVEESVAVSHADTEDSAEYSSDDDDDTEPATVERSGNGESADDADTAPPRRRRRSSTYRRGGR